MKYQSETLNLYLNIILEYLLNICWDHTALQKQSDSYCFTSILLFTQNLNWANPSAEWSPDAPFRPICNLASLIITSSSLINHFAINYQ